MKFVNTWNSSNTSKTNTISSLYSFLKGDKPYLFLEKTKVCFSFGVCILVFSFRLNTKTRATH